MAVTDLYQLHGINFPSGSFLSQISDGSLVSNTEIKEIFAAGMPVAQNLVNVRQKPMISGTTSQLRTAFSGFGPQGVDLNGGNTDYWFKKAKDAAAREADASTVHWRVRTNKGFGFITGITARDGDCSATFEIHPRWDGTNAVVQLLADASYLALSGTPTAAEDFTLGPVVLTGPVLNGGDPYTLNQLVSWSISWNYELITPHDNGDFWPTYCGIRTVSSRLTIETQRPTDWSKIGLVGATLTAVGCYMRRKDRLNNYANGASQHLLALATLGQVVPQTLRGGGSDDASTTLEIVIGAASPTSALWALSVDQTIS